MPTGWNRVATKLLSLSLMSLCVLYVSALATEQFGTPKGDEGTRIVKATEHPHYSGQFHACEQIDEHAAANGTLTNKRGKYSVE